jgi:hypothetical protein
MALTGERERGGSGELTELKKIKKSTMNEVNVEVQIFFE